MLVWLLIRSKLGLKKRDVRRIRNLKINYGKTNTITMGRIDQNPSKELVLLVWSSPPVPLPPFINHHTIITALFLTALPQSSSPPPAMVTVSTAISFSGGEGTGVRLAAVAVAV